MASNVIYGPMENKYEGTCLHCGFKLEIKEMIYWSKVRPTKEQFAAGVKLPKCTIHEACFTSWRDKDNYTVMPYRGQGAIIAGIAQRRPVTPVHDAGEASEQDETSIVQSQASNDLLGLIASSILPLVEAKLKTTLDTAQIIDVVNDIVDDKLKNNVKTLRLEIASAGELVVKDMGVQHKQFETLLKSVSAKHEGRRLNVWLAGPAGSGKSKASEFVAEALNLSYHFIGSITETHELFGYVSPIDGKYYGTGFRECVENGGVFCLDDFDGSDPVACVKLLGALGGSTVSFPDKMVKRHPDCCIILTANTWGHGATSEYVGRMKQDAALLDRFVKIKWELDEQLEEATCSNLMWVKRVQGVRRNVAKHGLKVLVTPRASYHGAALLAAGKSHEEVEQETLANGMSNEQWEMVR